MTGFRNPVIPGFHPDPSVCRVGDDYFLVTSSFTSFPGVPIFRSPNLVDWTQIGNVLDRPSQLDLEETTGWASAGIYAPTIRHHDGRFSVITTLTSTRGTENFFVTTTDPAGPWSDPVAVGIDGIDPDLAWDDDGACRVHFSGLGGIARVLIDDIDGRLLSEPELTWSGTGLQFPEAPHLLRLGDTCYLIIAEGGTGQGHAVSIARGPTPDGPWESNPANPMLSHRSTAAPIQNTGHADLVEAADGTWWLVALGVRLKGMSPGFHVLGRETFLAPVEWVDGWPVVEPLLEEMPHEPPALREPVSESPRDDFDDAHLHPRWLSVRRPPHTFASLAARAGWLTLTGTDDLDSHRPAYLGRRQQHHWCRAATKVVAMPGVRAGLAVMMDETAHYEIAVIDERVVVDARIGPLRATVADADRPVGDIELVIETRADYFGPDRIALGYRQPGGPATFLAHLDGRYLATEVTTGFIGRTIGMFVAGGTAAFDWFDYEPTD